MCTIASIYGQSNIVIGPSVVYTKQLPLYSYYGNTKLELYILTIFFMCYTKSKSFF